MSKTITRRSVLKGAAHTFGVATLASLTPKLSRSAEPGNRWDTIVVGAGVFGSWSAWHLQRKGHRVLLVDAWGPAHARASSGGESRLTRAAYGGGWIDTDGDYYGMPDLEARGFKIACDTHGPPIDPDTGDRQASAEGLANARAFMRKRFPTLANRPLVESRVCQYENSSNGDLLIDRHPQLENVWLAGAGSGHGFKHGPDVGRYTAELITGGLAARESRFSLASKARVQERGVH